MQNLNNLFLIPARKGSKGLPKKNSRLLKGSPLVCYTFEYVLKIMESNDEVCVSTDDQKIIELAKPYGFKVIERPIEFSQDNSTMDEVINHVLEDYRLLDIHFKSIVILQPTSPIRDKIDFLNLKKLYNKNIDMVVSVCEARENPYYLLYEENDEGFIFKSKDLEIHRRQDSPKVYRLNGSFFMINSTSLINNKIKQLKKILKYEMPYERSIDIDDHYDWDLVDFYLNKKTRDNNENYFKN